MRRIRIREERGLSQGLSGGISMLVYGCAGGNVFASVSRWRILLLLYSFFINAMMLKISCI